MTQEEILGQLLEAYEAKGDMDFDTFIAEQAKKLGFSEEQSAFLNESNAVIDSINNKALSLKEAKDKGKSREQWLSSEMDSILKDKDEKEKEEFIEGLNTALATRLEDYGKEIEEFEQSTENEKE